MLCFVGLLIIHSFTMNFRHPRLVITLRVLFGLFILMSGVTGMMAGAEMNGVPAPIIPASQDLYALGIFQMIKITEIVAGLMLVTGFLPALAAIFIAPIAVGILVFNGNVAPAYVITGLVVCAFEAYFGYAYWDKYKALFQR